MRLKVIIFLSFILTSCETTNKKVDNKKEFKSYSNNGFALIYKSDYFKKKVVTKKIDQSSLIIFNDKLKAIKVCTNRFDDETKQAFLELYDKVDADVDIDKVEE